MRDWPLRPLVAAVAATAFLLLFAGSALADPPGANGTVKIHDGDTENEPIVANEPQVCTFHIHGFFFDATQSGTWRMDQQPPTGTANVVAETSWTASASGEWRTSVMSLANGHYMLTVTITHDAGSNTVSTEKHKVIWVECPAAPVTGGAISAPTSGPSPVVGGVQQAPAPGQRIGLNLPPPERAIAGQEQAPQAANQAPVSGVQSLPSTSTGDHGAQILALTALLLTTLLAIGRLALKPH